MRSLAFAAEVTVLLAVASMAAMAQDKSGIDEIVEAWADPDWERREAATTAAVAGWADWSESDLDRIRAAAGNPDGERARRAASALDRIEVRRAIGPILVRRLDRIDRAVEPDGLAQIVAEAIELWRRGILVRGRKILLHDPDDPPP